MTKNKIHDLLRSNTKKGKRFINGNRMVVVGRVYNSLCDKYGTLIYELYESGEEYQYTKDVEIATNFLYEGRKEERKKM